MAGLGTDGSAINALGATMPGIWPRVYSSAAISAVLLANGVIALAPTRASFVAPLTTGVAKPAMSSARGSSSGSVLVLSLRQPLSMTPRTGLSSSVSRTVPV